MYFVYLLQSKSNPKKIYIGYTSDIKKRFYEHNHSGEGFTAKFRPWNLIYFEAYSNRVAAIRREMQFKRHGNVMVRLKLRLGLTS